MLSLTLVCVVAVVVFVVMDSMTMMYCVTEYVRMVWILLVTWLLQMIMMYCAAECVRMVWILLVTWLLKAWCHQWLGLVVHHLILLVGQLGHHHLLVCFTSLDSNFYLLPSIVFYHHLGVVHQLYHVNGLWLLSHSIKWRCIDDDDDDDDWWLTTMTTTTTTTCLLMLDAVFH